MVKNTATRRLFRKKCGETGPQAGTKNGEKAQRSGFFVSLDPAARRGFSAASKNAGRVQRPAFWHDREERRQEII